VRLEVEREEVAVPRGRGYETFEAFVVASDGELDTNWGEMEGTRMGIAPLP